MDEAEVSRIVGRPDGWVPRRESDHFMLCPVCGEMLDMRRLDQAMEHVHDGPEEPSAEGCMSIDWEAYAKGVEADIARIRQYLTPLESGEMRLGSKEGDGPWRDVTQEAIERERRALATYEAILKDVRANRIGNS